MRPTKRFLAKKIRRGAERSWWATLNFAALPSPPLRWLPSQLKPEPYLSHNIYELFAEKFADALASPFLTVPEGLTYTYGQVDRRSAAIATVLAEGGAEPGDRVVVQVEKSADAVALYLACLRAGFVYVPLNTAYTPEEVGFYLGCLLYTSPSPRDS